MASSWSWAALRLQAEDVWQQVLFQWDIATAGAQDMQWVDTLDFVWDSLPDGDKLTAKEKRQIAASLRQLVRQQSTDLYHKQQHHKETIMRRQAMLAQMHLEQLASKRLEQMVTMSHIAREQSMLLPAASELLAGISSSSSSQQQQPATAAAADPRQQQWQQTPPDAAQHHGSSWVRLPLPQQQQQQQWQRPERSRLSAASSQRLPSVLEQQGSLEQLLGDAGPAASVQGLLQSNQCQQQSDRELDFGPLSELEPAQEGPGEPSSGTAVVIDIPGDHHTFLPLAAAAAAASTSASWPAGREVLSGSSSSNSRLGDRQEDRVSRGGSSSSWWRGWGGGVPQGGLTEPLLQQQEVRPMLAGDGAGSETAAEAGVCSPQAYQAQQVATCPPTTAAYQCTNHQQQQQQSASAGSSRGHLPAAARQTDAQPLLLERYLSSSDADASHDLSAAAAAAAVAAAAVAAASEGSAGGAAPAGTLNSVHSQDSIGSSSTDCTASSEQPVHPTSHHQQQRGSDRVAAAAAGDLMKGGAKAVPGRCSCDTSSSNVDTPRKAPGGQVVGGISLVQQQHF